MKYETTTQQVNSAVNEGWVQGSSFVSSILAGTLLGYLADWWLGTDPWLVVTGVLLGSYSGFLHLWRWSREVEDARRQP